MKVNIERIFDASYERALAGKRSGRTFIEAFYDRFIAASPLVREKFAHTDMHRQVAMLEKSLHYIAYLFTHDEVYDHVRRVARIHDRAHHDIPPELYDLWLESLIDTVREFDPEFNDNIELAWRLVLARGIAYMKFMHGRPGAEGPVGR